MYNKPRARNVYNIGTVHQGIPEFEDDDLVAIHDVVLNKILWSKESNLKLHNFY
jgi:hypothetical protein